MHCDRTLYEYFTTKIYPTLYEGVVVEPAATGGGPYLYKLGPPNLYEIFPCGTPLKHLSGESKFLVIFVNSPKIGFLSNDQFK